MSAAFIAIVIFIVTYIFIITEKIPSAVLTMTGAFFLLLFGILNQERAISFIDFNTLGLLIGMMVCVAILRKTGIFEYLAIKAAKSTQGDPWRILVSMALITAVLSAFLDNVTTVLIIVPITFAIADAVKMNPMPLLIAEILFSNIGGTATLIGDPPNIMIGGATELGFMDFLSVNLPVVIVISIFVLFCLKKIYAKNLIPVVDAKERLTGFDEKRTITDFKFLIKSLALFSLVLLGFIFHQLIGLDLASIALGGGFIMLLFSGLDPEEILQEVEWPTIFFFIGLFVLIGGLEETYVILALSQKMMSITGGVLYRMTMFILWLSAFSTTLLNSIPYTATMISIIKSIAKVSPFGVRPLWWALSLGACLGGNGTIIGAAANIIVVGFSRRSNHQIKFFDFFKIGFPIMIGTILISMVYLHLRFFAFR